MANLTIFRRCSGVAISFSLCGGLKDGMNRIFSAFNSARTDSAIIRCAICIGLKVPANTVKFKMFVLFCLYCHPKATPKDLSLLEL